MDHLLPRQATTEFLLQTHPLKSLGFQNSSTDAVDVSYVVVGAYGTDMRLAGDACYLPPYAQTAPTGVVQRDQVDIQLHVQARQSLDSIPSGKLYLTLHGVIQTGIGKHKAIEEILCITQHCSVSDLVRNVDSGDPNKNLPLSTSYSKVVTFDVCNKALPSSTSIEGSKYVTEHTALADQRLVHGHCKVHYWITASCDTAESPSRLRFNSKIIHISSPTLLATFASSRTLARQPARERFKARCNAILSCSRPAQSPTMSFSVPTATTQPTIFHKSSSKQYLRLPITITITLPSSNAAKDMTRLTILRQYLLQKGFLDAIKVTANWHMRHTFGLGPKAIDHTINKELVYSVTRDSQITFPPFYAESGQEFVASTELEVVVPQTVTSTASFASDLLQISHSLKLEFAIKQLSVAGVVVLGACAAELEVQCEFSSMNDKKS